MTETAATYKTEGRLPECETGSVERMLEAAIEWSEKLEPRNSTSMPGFKVYECETQNPVQIAPSQTQLLRNILAKMRDGQEPPGKDWIRTHMRIGQCPSCDAKLVIAIRAIEATTHG